MIQSLFIINSNGEVIIEYNWRGLGQRKLCDWFWAQIIKYPSPADAPPVMYTPDHHYLIHVQHVENDQVIFFLSTLSAEFPPLLVTEFLNMVVTTFQNFFGAVNEDRIKDNFVTVYQILEEMGDNGYPVNTEGNVIQELIVAPSVLDKVMTSVIGPSYHSGVAQSLPASAMSFAPWRKPKKYTSNEIYIDIVEEIDCVIDNNGGLVNSEVHGSINVNCKLSGMPDLLMTFENPTILDDMSFHQCVRYQRWLREKVLSFVPPDGRFVLGKYKITSGQPFQPPVYCKPQIVYGQDGGDGRINIMVGIKNSSALAKAEDVVINITFPKTIATVSATPPVGQFVFDDATKTAKWIVGALTREKSPILMGKAILSSGVTNPPAPSVTVDFRAETFSISGLKVSSLHVHNENYKPFKGVKYISKAGKYSIRC